MDFRIADTFTDSLARLTGDEQKAVKTTAFDLQLNPANPGMNFHKLDNARDSNFWSVRVSADIRLIVHRSDSSLLLCYVDHHDRAYRWAERRKLDVHPKTGAAQFVEIRERVEEVRVPRYIDTPVATAKPALFASTPEQLLLGFGVPRSGWPMSGRPPKTRCSIWSTIFRRRRRKPCWSWRPAESPRPHRLRCRQSAPSSTRTHSAASAWCPASRSWSARCLRPRQVDDLSAPGAAATGGA